MRTIRFTTTAALFLAVSGAQAATNLVVNGSFELGAANIGSFQGWQTTLGDASTFVDSNGQTGTHYGQASDGLWSAFFGSTAASGGSTISQTLGTAAGQTYRLSFDLANDNAGSPAFNGLTVKLDGATVLSFSNLATRDYAVVSTTFIATGMSQLLSISAFNDTGYLEVDRVSVSAVPEPATAVLALLGLVAIGIRTGSRGARCPALSARVPPVASR